MDTRETDRRSWNEDWSDQGYELYDASGDKVGDIREVNPDYLIVELEGGLLEFLGLSESRTIYVPRDHIAREDGERWYLNIDKDRLEEKQDWTDQPRTDYYADESQREAAYVDDASGGRVAEAGRTRLVRYEEDLDVDKVSRPAGEVTVNKRVVEDTKTVDVPVRREEVHVERHPVGASADRTQSAAGELGSDEAFGDESITMPVMEEDVEVRKVARPVEEVEISKSQREETRQVDGSVRREEFDIDDSTERRDTDRF